MTNSTDYSEPTPPDSLPKYLVDGVQKQDPATLRNMAEYAEALAAHKESTAQQKLENESIKERNDNWDEDDFEEELTEARQEADLPAGKGTLTTKTIDGRQYYYLQWRDGDKIKSKYVAPVSPAGDE